MPICLQSAQRFQETMHFHETIMAVRLLYDLQLRTTTANGTFLPASLRERVAARKEQRSLTDRTFLISGESMDSMEPCRLQLINIWAIEE